MSQSSKSQVELYSEDVVTVKPIKLAQLVGVPPQMIYSYIRQSFISSVTSESGHKLIPVSAANEFITKRNNKAAKQNS
jgi:predicted site-specific integrase-resolvase